MERAGHGARLHDLESWRNKELDVEVNCACVTAPRAEAGVREGLEKPQEEAETTRSRFLSKFCNSRHGDTLFVRVHGPAMQASTHRARGGLGRLEGATEGCGARESCARGEGKALHLVL